MDRDGTQAGYDIELTRRGERRGDRAGHCQRRRGRIGAFRRRARPGGASAVLAASLFHFGTFTIPQVKAFLAGRGVPVRV